MRKNNSFILLLVLVFMLMFFNGCNGGSSGDETTGGGDNNIGDTISDDDSSDDSDDDSDSGDTDPDPGDVVDDTDINNDSPLAINLASLTYYSRQWTFLDQTKQGGGFSYAASPGATDENGWVLSGDVGLFLNTGLDGNYPGGRYIVLYDGEADFYTRTTIWDASGDPMSNDAVLNDALSTPGRLVLDVTPSNSGFVLSYENISGTDPVKNIQIVHEDYEDTFEQEIFHPTFIESIKHFNTLRFMDLMRTNNSDQSLWEDRPKTTDALQGSSDGVALEYLIALANKASANPWFNIPHQATDDYIEHFATMVRDLLDPDLKVYVEYSNEVWNGGFEQYDYARIQGEAAGLGTDRDAADRYYCRRSVEIFNIFEAVFAQTGRQGLVKVIASQNSPWWATRMMDWVDPSTGERAIDHADYWAVAPYFCGSPPSDPGSVDALLDICEASIDDTLGNALEIGDAARSYGVELIAYEGGQHIRNDSANAAAQEIYNLANDDARMGELYTQYLNKWRNDVDGQMFALFSLISGQSVYGRWGIMIAQDEFDYPKYQAAMDFITDNPVWW